MERKVLLVLEEYLRHPRNQIQRLVTHVKLKGSFDNKVKVVDDDEPIEEDSPKTSRNSQLRITPILKQACRNKAPNSVASELVKEMAVYAKAPANPSKLMKVMGG